MTPQLNPPASSRHSLAGLPRRTDWDGAAGIGWPFGGDSDVRRGSPVPGVLASVGWRLLITGFLFGTTGALIALSPVGKRSGAHINPIVTLAFRLMELDSRTSLGYVVAQLSGAILGVPATPCLGRDGPERGVRRHRPGRKPRCRYPVLLGEVITTFAMVTLLCVFLAFRRIRPFTPALFPFLYAFMVYAESPISGTSTNPARSLGPAVISGQWDGWWIQPGSAR